MRTRTQTRSFNGGIVSPELYGRPDLDKYASGLKDCINMIPLAHGPVKRRPGHPMVNRSKKATFRLIPFIYSADQALVLELGDEYLRMHVNGGTLLESNVTITGVSIGNQAVFTYTGTNPSGFSNGDWVYIDSLVGTVESFNKTYWEVTALDNVNKTFKLKDPYTGSFANTLGLAYTSGGTFARVYEVKTPFDEADLFELRYDQTNDVITVSQKNYATVRISRSGATDWSVTTETFSASAAFSTNPRLIADSSDADNCQVVSANGSETSADINLHAYKITAVIDGEETLPSPIVPTSDPYSVTQTGFDGGNYYLTSTAENQVEPGEFIYVTSTVEPFLNGKYFFVVSETEGSNRMFIGDFDTEANITDTTLFAGTHASGETEVVRCSLRTDLSVSGKYNKLNWEAIANADYYRVYKLSANGNVFGYAGRVETPRFLDKNVVPDLSRTPPIDYSYFSSNNPVSVGSFEQRRVIGGTVNDPTKTYLSRSGLPKNFFQSVPLQDDDAIVLNIAVGQQNAVRHIVSLDDLILLTSGSVIRVFSTNGDPITNENIMPRIIDVGGASNTVPVMAKSAILYEAAVGGHIQEVSRGEKGGYLVSDVSVIAPHLFDGYTFKDMTYSRAPVSSAWAVRSDGALLSLTYLPEHKVTAWARHDTGSGTYKTVAAIPESGKDALYVGTNRTVNGVTQGFIERVSDTFTPTTRAESVYLDGSIVYSGTSTDTINGLWHYEGETLSVLRDGAVHKDVTVSGGKVTLDTAGTNIVVGYKQTEVGFDLLPFYLQNVSALGVGTQKSVIAVWLRLQGSAGPLIGPNTTDVVDMEVRRGEGWDTALNLYSGVIECPIESIYSYDGTLSVRISNPVPLTVLSTTSEIELGN